MSNVTFLGGRLVIFVFAFLAGELPACCQSLWDTNPYDASRRLHYAGTTPFSMIPDAVPVFPAPPTPLPAGTVSADVLRNPLSRKARRALVKAMHHADLGDHKLAIQHLREALAQYPQAAPYTLTLLGAELMEVHRYLDAVDAFERVARTMPHLSAAHSNFGLSLALTGKIDAAERELRQALALDHGNSKARHILEAVLVSRRKGPQQTAAGLTPLP